MNLEEIGEEIRTQDNMATDHPIFILYDQIRHPTEDGYEDEYIYVDRDNDCNEIEDTKEALVDYFKDDEWLTNEIKQLSKEDLFEECQKHYCIERFAVQIIREFRQAFFTKKSAELYLEQNRHHFKNPLIWCDTLWRNEEMKTIRQALMDNKLNIIGSE